jgi:tetratricopeptide (TPR) repeat protein
MRKKESKPSASKSHTASTTKALQPERYYPFPKKYILGVIVLYTSVLFFNTLWSQYALDDSIVIKENMFTQQGFAGIKKIMSTDVFLGFFKVEKALVAGGRYRPLSLVTFAIEHELWGDIPAISHAINFLLYALTGIFIFLFLSRLFLTHPTLGKLKYLSLLAALLYIAHPIHTEAVANIKGRDEIMSMLFAVMSAHFYLKHFDEKKISNLLIAVVCFMASLLSKENSITWVLIFPLTIYFFRETNFKSLLTPTLSAFMVAGIYLLLRNSFTNTKLNVEITEILNNPFYGATLEQQLSTVIYTWGKYMLLLLFPHPLTHDYYFNQIPWKSFLNAGVIISTVFYAGLVIVAFVQFKKKTLLSYCILFFGITFSIVSNLLFPIGTTMSERFVYMASFGFTTYLAYLLCYLPQLLKNQSEKYDLLKVKPVLALALIILSGYSIKTIARNPVWKDNYTLFSTDIHTSPNSAKLNNALGGTALEFLDKPISEEEKKFYVQQAKDALNKAVSIYPKFENAWLLLGNASLKGDSDIVQAIRYYVKSLEANPGYPEAKNNIQVALNKLKNDERVPVMKKMYDESGYNPTLGYYYAIQLRRADQYDEALRVLLRTIRAIPDYAEALSDVGLIYGQNKMMIDSSIYYLTAAVQANPDLEDANDNLAVAYGVSGNFQMALQILQQAIQRNPNHSKYYSTMSATYRALGDNNMASYYAEEAKKREQVELKH